MTAQEEFKDLLAAIQSRAALIQQTNEISLDRQNVEFGLERLESYIADIRGLVYEASK